MALSIFLEKYLIAWKILFFFNSLAFSCAQIWKTYATNESPELECFTGLKCIGPETTEKKSEITSNQLQKLFKD